MTESRGFSAGAPGDRTKAKRAGDPAHGLRGGTAARARTGR
jgi:hypothetical protein